MIREEEIDINSLEQTRRTLEAILNLRHGDYNHAYVKALLKRILNKFYNERNVGNLIRQAVSYVDIIKNRP